MLRSIAWNIFGSASLVLVNLIFGILLARLINPIHFGSFALIVALPSIYNALLYFVLKHHLIQSDSALDSLRSTGRLYQKFLRVFELIALILCAVLCLVHALSFELFLSIVLVLIGLECFGFWAYKQIGLELKADYKKISNYRLGAAVISGLIALIMAYYGFELLALATRYLLNYLLLMLFYYSIRFKQLKMLRTEQLIKDFKTMGIYQSFEIIVQYIDNILIGIQMGTANLAYYSKSYQLFSKPVELLSGKAFETLLPQVFRLDQKERVSILSQMFILIQIIQVPMLIFIAIYSRELIVLILGNNWESAHIAVRWFALANIINYHLLFSNILLSIPDNDMLRKMGNIKNVMLLLAIIVGSFFSLRILVICFFIATLFSSLVFLVYLAQSYLSKQLSLNLILYPIVLTGLSYLLNFAFSDLSNPYTLLITHFMASLLLILVGLWLYRNKIKELFQLIKILGNAL